MLGQPLAMKGTPVPADPAKNEMVPILDYSKIRSVSQLGTFASCGEAYRLQKVAKAPRSPAAWFTQGTAFHTATEAWENSRREISDDTVVETFYLEYDTLIAQDLHREPDLNNWLTGGRTKAQTDIDNRRARGANQVIDYLKYCNSSPERVWSTKDDVAVEVEFHLDLDGLIILGYIDQLIVWPDGQVSVRDLKTGTKRPDWAFQLGVYALAVEQDWGYRPRYGDYYIAKDGRPDPLVDLSRFTRPMLTRWFHNLDKAVKLGAFVPNPGDGCRTCAVQDFCQAIDGERAHVFAPTS